MRPKHKAFIKGAKGMLPVTPGILPFGLVAGTVAANAGLNLLEVMSLSFIVLAGASQLAAIELMNHQASIIVVVATGIIINLRFMMYSTSLAPHLRHTPPLKRLGLAYLLTDQIYAVSVYGFKGLDSRSEKLWYYLGAALTMCLVWHSGTLIGAIFGDVAPKSWSLDFVVPLTFTALVVPNLKDRIMMTVAAISFAVSILASHLPLNLGLLAAALISLGLGAWLKLRKEKQANG